MKPESLIQALTPLAVHPMVWSKAIRSDEIEQRKIVMMLNRIKAKDGSVQHFIQYLNLVLP